ncbi:MAG: acyl-CoA thioesterase [Candidatus Hodarchaeota archaeon]
MEQEKEKKIREKLLDIEDFKEIEVRVDDTDLMGVVHANKYLNYFDDGYISLMKKLDKDCGALHKEGIVFPVRKIEVEYIKSAEFGDTIIVGTRILKIGNTSMTIGMSCYRNKIAKDALVVKGTIVRLIMSMENKELLNIIKFFDDII